MYVFAFLKISNKDDEADTIVTRRTSRPKTRSKIYYRSFSDSVLCNNKEAFLFALNREFNLRSKDYPASKVKKEPAEPRLSLISATVTAKQRSHSISERVPDTPLQKPLSPQPPPPRKDFLEASLDKENMNMSETSAHTIVQPLTPSESVSSHNEESNGTSHSASSDKPEKTTTAEIPTEDLVGTSSMLAEEVITGGTQVQVKAFTSIINKSSAPSNKSKNANLRKKAILKNNTTAGNMNGADGSVVVVDVASSSNLEENSFNSAADDKLG